MKEKDEKELTICSRIPQEEIKDPKSIAASYSSKEIAESFAFKIRARNGAIELGHKEYAKFIQEQMNILDEALYISEGKKSE